MKSQAVSTLASTHVASGSSRRIAQGRQRDQARIWLGYSGITTTQRYLAADVPRVDPMNFPLLLTFAPNGYVHSSRPSSCRRQIDGVFRIAFLRAVSCCSADRGHRFRRPILGPLRRMCSPAFQMLFAEEGGGAADLEAAEAEGV
jgi:hypothetical protein